MQTETTPISASTTPSCRASSCSALKGYAYLQHAPRRISTKAARRSRSCSRSIPSDKIDAGLLIDSSRAKRDESRATMTDIDEAMDWRGEAVDCGILRASRSACAGGAVGRTRLRPSTAMRGASIASSTGTRRSRNRLSDPSAFRGARDRRRNSRRSSCCRRCSTIRKRPCAGTRRGVCRRRYLCNCATIRIARCASASRAARGRRSDPDDRGRGLSMSGCRSRAASQPDLLGMDDRATPRRRFGAWSRSASGRHADAHGGRSGAARAA